MSLPASTDAGSSAIVRMAPSLTFRSGSASALAATRSPIVCAVLGRTDCAVLRTPAAGCDKRALCDVERLRVGSVERAEPVDRPQRVDGRRVQPDLVHGAIVHDRVQICAARPACRARRADAARASATACCRGEAPGDQLGRAVDAERDGRVRLRALPGDPIDAPAAVLTERRVVRVAAAVLVRIAAGGRVRRASDCAG